jgi:SAM-dependent methyltransferase
MEFHPGITEHEKRVSEFYGSFPYPWNPMSFETVDDPDFYTTLVRQESGRGDAGSFRTIWVAGCGTNQALITALRFPGATVVGTDVSPRALQICEENAKQVGATNLILEQRGISGSEWSAEFDLIICTGVIHHNPEPRDCLLPLSAALRDRGILELMVYNKFHRRETSAFQEAMRIVFPEGSRDHPFMLRAAREVANSIGPENSLTRYLREAADDPDEVWADNWMNPCERSYDVCSLWELAASCHLTVEAPKLSAFDKAWNQFQWTLEPPSEEFSSTFFALTDRERWQVVNLLHMDQSPMLWFYLRSDQGEAGDRVTELDRNEIFLGSVLKKPTAVQRRYLLEPDGTYKLSPRTVAIGRSRPRDDVQDIWQAADGTRTAREMFADLGRDTDFNSVYRARLALITPECPHLVMSGS